MFLSMDLTNAGAMAREAGLRAVRTQLACALIGSTVDLLADTHTILHGVVTGVLTEAGTPKIVVAGARYDLDQVLTNAPASLN